MDWGRAKMILILSFLFLNMILGFQLWNGMSEQTQLAADTSGLVEELNRVMNAKNIRLTKELPNEVPKLKEITVKVNESIGLNEKIALSTPTTITRILAKGAGKDDPARKEIQKLDLYQFDAVASKDGMFVFNQTYDSLPMFEVKTELYETEGQIVSYRQAYVEVESDDTQKEQTIIPAQLAVRSLVENYLLEGSVIIDVRLGYHGQLYNSQTQYMAPHWRVALGSGDIYYVQAFNGAVVIPQTGIDDAQDILGGAKSTPK
ncbi:two-component system regulatory protein YycI [Paenibacillus eucommiae]|uniref:Regulatory protein YycI of two-component signal transduction system YycFG n=1 Tax=Paenibacillus eucommiae TaxID=1355755 RepID=A0ABS4J479_9BACL|nr:two-component system regulatory protein YycI [Paenibacillus eucommiae]MBP1994637.1 regulatory protein YycI of two-component signal transduction system YycFG [Paenibacillus eucommiae]